MRNIYWYGGAVVLLAVVGSVILLPSYYFAVDGWTGDAEKQKQSFTVYGMAATTSSDVMTRWFRYVQQPMAPLNASEVAQRHQWKQRHYRALRNGTVAASPLYQTELLSWQQTCEKNASACPDGPHAAVQRELYREAHHLLYGMAYNQIVYRDRARVEKQLLPPDAAIARHNLEMMLSVPAAMYNARLTTQTCPAADSTPEDCFQELADTLENGSWTFTAEDMMKGDQYQTVYTDIVQEHARISQETTVPHLKFTAYASAAFLTTCERAVKEGVYPKMYDAYGGVMKDIVPHVEANVTADSSYHLKMGTCLFAGSYGFPGLNISISSDLSRADHPYINTGET